jgi:hypothetical protein
MIINNRVVGYIITLLIILNIIDAFSTLYFVSCGYATELNPLMDILISKGWGVFLFIKLFVSITVCYIFWILRNRKLIKIVLIPITFVYLYIFIKHCKLALNVFC